MTIALVTYTAPEGDEATTTICGLDFVSGEPVEIDAASFNPAFLKVLRNNRFFEVVESAQEAKRGPGRPRKSDADAENV